jgi:3-hydroxyisobutyrate dehydrogenase
MAIGYIGLGNMGGALARRLQLTHPLFVYDLDAIARQRAAETGAIPCATAAELGARCEMILLCLPKSEHVHSVVFGETGLAASLRPGMLIIDQTTGHPAATREMARELAARRIDLIDAPVSGGVQGAAAGTISIMVGATPTQFVRASPILESISPNVLHVGDVGTGHAMKLVNNLISGAQRALTFEGMSLAAKNGVDPRKAAEVLLAGGARNAFMEKFLGAIVADGRLASNFTLELMLKDLSLACDLARDCAVPVPIGSVARDAYASSIEMLGGDADVNAVGIRADRIAGTQVVSKAGETRGAP